MKKQLLTAICVLVISTMYAQNYPNILNYAGFSTPVHGVKIKTNMPFTDGTQMPTISILGYSYGSSAVIDLKIVYYIYSGYFAVPTISSAGGYAPKVYLANENGKVVIFIDDKVYYQRFTISAFAHGMSETLSWFQGWTTADEPISNTAVQVTELPYRNRFGDINFINGKVGIGVENPSERLMVKGKIVAEEIKVQAQPWPDYVFAPNYKKCLCLSWSDSLIKTNTCLKFLLHNRLRKRG
ncbi:hypothetical protein [Niabella hibiscisoli]|uniref:hypothetical protein n=1 Tax=Niabella hibiscisoli TaxID=1825928 RepID=UPI001F105304|nr:hypothetical protein [Niabella hibiscisoli]MCH5718212.1 hypothetical protein [Niabella hibiscisoli]